MQSHRQRKWVHTLKDLTITLILWGYYTIGFIILFAPFYVCFRFFSTDVTQSFQRLNTRFYRWFFVLLRYLAPAGRSTDTATGPSGAHSTWVDSPSRSKR